MNVWTCPFSTPKDSTFTATQVLHELEGVHNQYINPHLKEQHTAYIFALRDFMEAAFEWIIQDIHSYKYFSASSKPLAKIFQALNRVKNIFIPDNFRMTLKKSVLPDDWKYMLLQEFWSEWEQLLLAAKNYWVPLNLLVDTLQGWWENAVDSMFDIFVRAEHHANGDINLFHEYCEKAERFLVRMSATSLSVHSLLLVDRKRILHENSSLTERELDYLKQQYASAAQWILWKSEKTESTEQVAAFANIPRTWCPALHAKDNQSISYILVFFRIFGDLYVDQFIRK
jgi:hypothetical protein